MMFRASDVPAEHTRHADGYFYCLDNDVCTFYVHSSPRPVTQIDTHISVHAS